MGKLYPFRVILAILYLHAPKWLRISFGENSKTGIRFLDSHFLTENNILAI